MTRVPFNYTWIEDGKILAGSIPQMIDDIVLLKQMGIQRVLSLTRRDIKTYPDLASFFIDDTFNNPHYAIPDGGIADDDIMLGAVRSLEYGYDKGKITYIHCRGGIGRTGTILQAYYVLARGMSFAQAKDIVRVRRNYEGNASAVDQGSPQHEWIESLEGKRDIWLSYFHHL